MKKLALAAVLLALPASAQEITGRALVSYQQYQLGNATTSGLRQTYDLRLERAFTMTSLVRLFLRGDDFRGTAQFAAAPQQSRTRQIQPMAELIVNTTNLHAQFRGEILDIRGRLGQIESSRRIDRNFGQLMWQPDGLPSITLQGQRNATADSAARVDLTDENALASAAYSWRDLHVTAGERYLRSSDPFAGFDRKLTTHEASLAYVTTRFDGKLTVTAEGNAQLSQIHERSVGGSAIPTQVIVARALYGVDDTPADGRDHPLAPAPLLTDDNLNAGAGISLGPEAVSFQNLALDLGRIDRVDEIRVLVRDSGGNPLRNGGGPVTWDAYTSQDGLTWTPLVAQTTFSAPLSLYSVRFDLTNSRWFKVVNFGVNAEQAAVTEVQAFFHAGIVPGGERSSTQNFYVATAGITLQPVKRFRVSYNGTYSSSRQEFSNRPADDSRDLENLLDLQFDLRSTMAVRAQLLRRDARTFTGNDNGADGITAFFDWNPTRQWRNSLEVSRQRQVIEGNAFTISTRALHSSAFVLKSLYLGLDGGTQTQTLDADGSVAERTFVSLNGNVQLAPTLRLLLNGTLQRNVTESSDPATQLLGPVRDNRLSAEFIWRPGRPLTLGARYGHVAGPSLSGFTQRYHVEWYPFADGTVSLGGAYDQDIDPVINRRATRMVLNPRWVMNRYAIFDINYTAVSSTVSSFQNRQHQLFATLTLIK